MKPPRIGISPGDPGGIGPEVIVRALSKTKIPPARYILFGPRSLWEDEAKAAGLKVDLIPWKADGGLPEAGVFFHDLSGPQVPTGKGVDDSARGAASFSWFESTVASARRSELEAVVTGPVSKHAWSLAGLPWRGHTEYLERFYPGAVMSFWSDRLTVALLSHHLSLREALGRVNPEALAGFFRVVYESAVGKTEGETEILVAGLNPHAGEEGLLGTEERDVIGPAIEEARRAGLPVRGPFPPDVVFRLAFGHPEKIVAAMYHDQGLIPFKLTAFESGVNVTLGLPFVRTSPDHGTAFDIAGKTPADPGSMAAALRLAVRLAGCR
ncbi:MAG: 4-hydroxythreonine-4-phosphate dehydrogenase PdxA [Candidatus Aminicenantes bacterium]|nr:4-hydroxythreonine-4-phosphate dehydrogenase PdxA [Candidatus Aminicenantes bacterium]